MAVTDWNLLGLFSAENDEVLALLVLNQPLTETGQDIFQNIWERASFRASVDGATNHLYRRGPEQYLPHVISGDFDSVKPDTLQWYKDKGIEVVHTPDQDFTDFTKGLQIVINKFKDKKLDAVIAYGAFGGRLDHMFANIDTLFTANRLAPGLPVYLCDDQNIACLLQQGSHRLHVGTGLEGDSCGLIPVGGQCDHVSTTGLKWNLDNQRLKFGELVSTSNTWAGDNVVTVTTDQPLLWTMNIKPN
ncbi:thiamin pyrophosphokinase 1-like [Mya arenaria]|uniref:thiamin pyrophosphokinase 1-like n=1 Tax=Mya arenaria TaxID=6604 RepID=UPI0022E19163|nr:thiamin pyrophosphokinase 1-like [Mya arenaria]